jgi:hypothetical protein
MSTGCQQGLLRLQPVQECARLCTDGSNTSQPPKFTPALKHTHASCQSLCLRVVCPSAVCWSVCLAAGRGCTALTSNDFRWTDGTGRQQRCTSQTRQREEQERDDTAHGDAASVWVSEIRSPVTGAQVKPPRRPESAVTGWSNNNERLGAVAEHWVLGK